MDTVAVQHDEQAEPAPLTKQDFEALARFRFAIRRHLRFSEETVRRHGLTPQQYQLLLALKGFPGREWATVGELAERLQLRHHSTVELVNRAQRLKLVHRRLAPDDARVVRIGLTSGGERVLDRLSSLHRAELERAGTSLALPVWETSREKARDELLDVLVQILADQGEPGRTQSIEAGRRWADLLPDRAGGEAQAAISDVFTRLGFAPDPGEHVIRLRACPFRAAARRYPQVVCQVHLGLAQRLAEQADDAVAVELAPFAGPELCLIALTHRNAV